MACYIIMCTSLDKFKRHITTSNTFQVSATDKKQIFVHSFLTDGFVLFRETKSRNCNQALDESMEGIEIQGH